MTVLQQLADVESSDSFSNRMRSARFEKFLGLASTLPKPIRILDIGGTNRFWEMRKIAGNDDFQITLLNLQAEQQKHSNITPSAGDATHMPEYEDNSFDVAFSNSVIEHLFTYENQQKMAMEVQRVAKCYWVQTPNFWFPIEPHFHVPGWQWMPKSIRIALLRRFRCGWRGPCKNRDEAKALVDEVRLMQKNEIVSCFSNGTVWAEKFYGLTKSWVAYGGFPSN
ncbi:MAG: class I SAM-dependent methyltransferase [Phycisphaeraceae bacterium]|nr:class I SAM-dependent methyltransferase [Phycisphaerales bacterium]MCB9861000.1 class I SAM-dependent methyltransferase [Phycisphaeraceae bacterium]